MIPASISLRITLSLAAISVASGLAGADWNQWRGPERTGVSAETGLADQWPQAGPRLVWQVKDLGDGYGSPTVAGERVFIVANEGIENEYVQALRVADGRPIWTRRIGNVGNPDQQPPYQAARSTPTLDGAWLYAFGSDGDIACLNAVTGEIRWQKNVRREFGGLPGTWAYAESPLVDGDVVVCTPGGSDATIVALNKHTGDLVWKCAVPSPVAEPEAAGYASAIVLELGGRKQYVQFLGRGVVGVDAMSGKFLWRYDATGGGPANIATPVAHEDHVYTAAGRGPGALIRLATAGEEVNVEQVYLKRGLPNGMGGSLELDGHLYGATTDQGQQGLVCVDLVSGEPKWQNESVGAASLCAADGLLFVHGENGEVALVEATSEGYRERGRFSLPDPPPRRGQMEGNWTYPAVSDGKLYLRDKNVMWCYDVSEAAASN